MATTVPIVGKRRVQPSVYLRPIAQPISQRPATSRKSQAIGMPPKSLLTSAFADPWIAPALRLTVEPVSASRSLFPDQSIEAVGSSNQIAKQSLRGATMRLSADRVWIVGFESKTHR